MGITTRAAEPRSGPAFFYAPEKVISCPAVAARDNASAAGLCHAPARSSFASRGGLAGTSPLEPTPTNTRILCS